MKTLIIKSQYAMSAPLPGTPVLPDYDPSLMASYDASSMDVSGTTLTKWRNKQGALGAKADLVTAKSQFPITVDQGAAVFLGGSNETYMDSQVFDTAVPLGKATFITRIRFGQPSDTVDNTVFSSTQTADFAFMRRKSQVKTFEVGISRNPAVATLMSAEKELWMDLVLVVDGNSSKFYIDDRVETVAVGTAPAVLPSLRLGANVSGVSRLIGRISHFRTYNRAIEADELKEIRATM